MVTYISSSGRHFLSHINVLLNVEELTIFNCCYLHLYPSINFLFLRKKEKPKEFAGLGNLLVPQIIEHDLVQTCNICRGKFKRLTCPSGLTQVVKRWKRLQEIHVRILEKKWLLQRYIQSELM